MINWEMEFDDLSIELISVTEMRGVPEICFKEVLEQKMAEKLNEKR